MVRARLRCAAKNVENCYHVKDHCLHYVSQVECSQYLAGNGGPKEDEEAGTPLYKLIDQQKQRFYSLRVRTGGGGEYGVIAVEKITFL